MSLRSWLPFFDDIGVVHHAARLARKDAEYLFRLAFMIRTLVSCVVCGAVVGQSCRRKSDGLAMSNHSRRVTDARTLVKERFEPYFDRLHVPLCVWSSTDGRFVVFRPARGREINCMACVAAMASVNTKT